MRQKWPPSDPEGSSSEYQIIAGQASLPQPLTATRADPSCHLDSDCLFTASLLASLWATWRHRLCIHLPSCPLLSAWNTLHFLHVAYSYPSSFFKKKKKLRVIQTEIAWSTYEEFREKLFKTSILDSHIPESSSMPLQKHSPNLPPLSLLFFSFFPFFFFVFDIYLFYHCRS